MKNTLIFTILVSILISFSSCKATMHTVGSGGYGNCKRPGEYNAKMKRWYLLEGLIPLNKADSQKLAKDYKNYTIRTTNSFGDIIISCLLWPFFGLCSQTIRVSYGAN